VPASATMIEISQPTGARVKCATIAARNSRARSSATPGLPSSAPLAALASPVARANSDGYGTITGAAATVRVSSSIASSPAAPPDSPDSQ